MPETLEDFVEEVMAKGAEQAKALEKAVAWHMKSKRLSAWYPFLVPGGSMKTMWDWILSLSILPSVVLYPLMLGFSDVMKPLNPLLVALDVLYWIGIALTFATVRRRSMRGGSFLCARSICAPPSRTGARIGRARRPSYPHTTTS